MRLTPSSLLSLVKQSAIGWQKDNASVWCAALAYYTVFSIGPLLLLIISIVGLVFSTTSIEKYMFAQLQGLLGSNSITMLRTIIQNAKKPSAGIIGSIIGTITLILGAIGVYGQLQQMLNTIWGVSPKPKSGIINMVRSRLINFSMIGVIAFLMVVSLLASTIISGMGTFLGHLLPFSPVILEVIDFIFSFSLITILFAIIMKVLPDVQIKWKNIWMGALLTAFLFTIGKSVIGIYIGHSGISSEFGAAASVVILLFWVYYSSQILFFGAEFTKAFTLMSGDEIIPNQYSVLIKKESTSDSGNSNKSNKSNLLASAASGFTEGFIDEVTQKNKRKR